VTLDVIQMMMMVMMIIVVIRNDEYSLCGIKVLRIMYSV